jgi:hypothetical protein
VGIQKSVEVTVLDLRESVEKSVRDMKAEEQTSVSDLAIQVLVLKSLIQKVLPPSALQAEPMLGGGAFGIISPLTANKAPVPGGTGSTGKTQLLIINFMHRNSSVHPHQHTLPLSDTLVIKNNTSYKNTHTNQTIISSYFTPRPLYHTNVMPPPPSKTVASPSRPDLSGLNLVHIFNSLPSETACSNSTPVSCPIPSSKTSRSFKQTSITQYFNVLPQSTQPSLPPKVVTKSKYRNARHAVLSYRRSQCNSTHITRFTTSMPSYDLFDSWGHSLETIEVSQTFRVFLQNPNGLSISKNNHLLLQDLQQCHDYGAAVLCMHETNTNWDRDSQLTTL